MAEDAPKNSLLEHARATLGALRLPNGETLAESGRLVLAGVGRKLTAAIRIDGLDPGPCAAVRENAEAALRALPGVEQAIVVLTAERDQKGVSDRGLKPLATSPKPLQTSQATTGPRPVAAAASRLAGGSHIAQATQASTPRPKPLAEVKHVVAVASGKGGVGKSTTAVNLALGLRLQGLKVGILDADVHGPSLPTLLNLTQKPRLGPDRRVLPVEAQGLKAMSMGLMVDDETAMIWRGPMVTAAITQMLAEVDWGALDVLIVDMPPGTGDAQLALAQGARLSGAVIVSTPQDLALIDARRGIAMFRKIEVPVLGLIENMAYFCCPDCGARHAIFGAGGVAAEAKRLGVPYLGAVPLDMGLRQASDSGRPPTARDPEGPIGSVFQAIARALLQELARLPGKQAKGSDEQ